MGRTVVVIALVLGVLAGHADARSRHPVAAAPARDEADLVEHGYYINSAGAVVHAPAHTRDGAVPPGASARCRDASWSFSRHRRGTCSGHGGVADWL
jgi:hypothetical protein